MPRKGRFLTSDWFVPRRKVHIETAEEKWKRLTAEEHFEKERRAEEKVEEARVELRNELQPLFKSVKEGVTRNVAEQIIKVLEDPTDRSIAKMEKISHRIPTEILIKIVAEKKLVRSNRAIAAAELGNRSGAKATQALIKTMQGNDEFNARLIAARALGEQYAATPAIMKKLAITALKKALTEDREAGIRLSAAESLGKTGDKTATKTLIEGLTVDKSSAVRLACAEALGKIGGEESLQALKNALPKEKDDTTRAFIKRAITRISR